MARGTKGTVSEGGVRAPLIVRLPAKVKPGASDAPVSRMDQLASFAALAGQAVPKGHAPDSESHLDALLGAKKVGRELPVGRSNGGVPFGPRHGTWKLVLGGGPKAEDAAPAPFDPAADLSESKDLAAAHPAGVAAMRATPAEITGQPLPKMDHNPEGE